MMHFVSGHQMLTESVMNGSVIYTHMHRYIDVYIIVTQLFALHSVWQLLTVAVASA